MQVHVVDVGLCMRRGTFSVVAENIIMCKGGKLILFFPHRIRHVLMQYLDSAIIVPSQHQGMNLNN